MRLFNWAKMFEENAICDDIPKRVRQTEKIYWIYMVIFIVIGIGGITTFKEAAPDDIKAHAAGVFWGLFAMINIAVMKIWAHIRLTTYYLIWDRQNRLERELRKSEAMDL